MSEENSSPMEVDNDLDVAEIREDGNISEDEDGGLRIGDIYIPPGPRPACTLDSTGPRMIITSIENDNFKSYAGKQTLGPFHKCFNAIVGPNGSGKSNVIDSMLFVFGYRASKIRSKKISVLLHNSDRHPNIQSCTVAVNFVQIIDKEGDEYEIVPNSKIVIARTAFKDSSSFYTLNGCRVQFKEIAKLLRGHGIDLDHNRFLILQGEVEQIAMMKPKGLTEHETGMLEFLEDIIGTSRYKEPIEKLNKRVEDLMLERTEKLNRLKIVEKEKDSLQGPKEEAIQFVKIENEITQTNNVLYQKYIKQTKINIETKEKAKINMDDGINDLKEKLKNIQNQKDEITKTKDESLKEFNVYVQKKEKLTEEFNKASNKDVSLNADITQLSKTRTKTKELLSEEKKKLTELELIPEKNSKMIKELAIREEQLSKEREKEEHEMKKVMTGMRAETQELQDKKEQFQTQLITLQRAVDETKSAYDITQSELDLYVSNEQKERSKLEQIEKNFDSTSKTLQERKADMTKLKDNFPKLEAQLKTAETDLTQVRAEDAVVTQQLRTQRSKVEESRTALQSTRSRGRVLDSLMTQKKDGNLPGIFGRLGDLGAIQQKYDVAISTACGPLDNIVVDTVETGQRCIEYLKNHDIGRATFIALEKQEHLRQAANTPIDTPENVPRLFDLIQIKDERVRPAFYFALRDTLVAENLSQATRIAYGRKRHRVVTLEGQVIEMSGTMSGGGRTKMHGRMGQSVVTQAAASPQDQRRMEQRLSELQTRSGHLRDRQGLLEGQVQTLTDQIRAMRMDLHKFTIDIKALSEQEPLLREQLKKQQQKVKAAMPDPVQVKKLTAARDATNKDYTKAAGAAGEVDKEVKKLHNKIMQLTGGRMKAAQKKLDEVTMKIDKVRQETTRLSVGIKTSKRNVTKSKEKISNMEFEIEDAAKRLTKMSEEKTKVENFGRETLDELNVIAEMCLKMETEHGGLNQELSKLSKAENELKASKLEVDQKMETVNKSIRELMARLSAEKKKLDALKMQDALGEIVVTELKQLTDEELEEVDINKISYQLTLLDSKLKEKKPNLSALQEYKEKESQYIRRANELEDVTNRRNETRHMHEDIRKKRLTEFMDGYSIITNKLKEMYQMITLGGDAEFELVDSLDPFNEGIVFSVRPPKKSWKNISNLSGGEKTLSSLALVFALHYYKPSPLYVMDEIDAALDFKNVSIVGNYIKERTKNAQFIIISLRSNMFELADHLVGIYKTYDCTKSVTINPSVYASLPTNPL